MWFEFPLSFLKAGLYVNRGHVFRDGKGKLVQGDVNDVFINVLLSGYLELRDSASCEVRLIFIYIQFGIWFLISF